MVVVEHRLQEVVADVDRLVLFHQGRLSADGPPRQVLEQELTGYGLNLPALVSLFRDSGSGRSSPPYPFGGGATSRLRTSPAVFPNQKD